MKHIKFLLFGLVLTNAAAKAQEAAPYNPDANNDQFINTTDLVNLLGLYNNPFFAPDDDLDPFNELQTLVLEGNTLTLEPGGGSVELPAGLNGIHCWDLNGNGIDDPEEDSNGDGVFSALDCQAAAPVGNCAVFGDFFDIPIGEDLVAPSDGIILAHVEGAPGWSLPPSTGLVIFTDSVLGYPNNILVAEEEGYYVLNNVTRTGATMPVKSGWYYRVASLGGATVKARFLPFLSCNPENGFGGGIEYKNQSTTAQNTPHASPKQAYQKIQYLVSPGNPKGHTLYKVASVSENTAIELTSSRGSKGVFELPEGKEGQKLLVCIAAKASLTKVDIRSSAEGGSSLGSIRENEARQFLFSGGRWLAIR